MSTAGCNGEEEGGEEGDEAEWDVLAEKRARRMVGERWKK